MTRDLQAAIRHADLTPAEQQIATFVTTDKTKKGRSAFFASFLDLGAAQLGSE